MVVLETASVGAVRPRRSAKPVANKDIGIYIVPHALNLCKPH